jgi:hypothetical protein
MEPISFFFIVLPLAIIVSVLVGVILFLSRKSEKTDYEKELKEVRDSYFKGKIDQKTFHYMKDNLRTEHHFFEESKRIDNLFENKKMDSDTYLRTKKILENSYNERLMRIHEKHKSPTKLSQKDFEKYLKVMMNQDYEKVKYKNPSAWRTRKKNK